MMKTFRCGHYNLVCSAEVCDNGTFRAALVVAKNVWPGRPRTIEMRRDRHPTAEVAIESAYAQGLEWIRNFG
jgi:hypothetical protein